MPAAETVHQIAVPVPLRKSFDYLGPGNLLPGVRVVVPFGPRRLTGVVLSTGPANTGHRLRSIIRVLDSEPVLDGWILRLLLWAAEYHHHPVGEVLAAGLPVKLRSGEAAAEPRGIRIYRASPDPAAEAPDALSGAPAQQRLHRALSREGWHTWPELTEASGCGRHVLRALLKRGLAETRVRLPQITPPPDVEAIRLNPEQEQAANHIVESLGTFRTCLLQGITGSGKTEVYLVAAREAIARGSQVLFLVPEISLTPQLIARVRGYLGDNVRCLHSGMSAQERYETWWLARAGRISAVLGTRSAIFTPLQNPGLIVVDEEHDQSYKQQDGFRYHARNLAIKLASLKDIPVVLGSATPSLESLHNAREGRHRFLQLSERFGAATVPEIRVIDSGIHPPRNGLTDPLLQAIAKRLDRGEQTIIYVNRRGYAPVVHCYQCGWQAACNHCSARLVYHRDSDRFRCHLCGHTEPAGAHCPQCGTTLFLGGAGTQRLEQALYGRFPGARLCRLDRDEAGTAEKLHSRLERIREGTVDIVIGTQLITKGHDFPRVTLVGVVNADQGLFSVDFRGSEFLLQELLQVAGRSGRARAAGEVFIQTAHPKHPCIMKLLDHDYMGFADTELDERHLAGYPPFAHLALFRAESREAGDALSVLERVRRSGEQILRQEEIEGVEILPPVPSPVERRAGRYRLQLMVRSRHRGPLHRLLGMLSVRMESGRSGKSARWSLDVDPMEMV